MARMKAFAKDLQQLFVGFPDRVDTLSMAAAIADRDKPRMKRLLRDAWALLDADLQVRFSEHLREVTQRRYGAAWNSVAPHVPYPPPEAAIAHADAQAARRVTAMTAASRGVINRLVVAAVSGRSSNQRLARALVRAGLPLDRPRADALARLHADLQDAVRDGTMTAEQADARLLRAAAKKARSRARTIARTETAEARGYARQEAFSDTVRRKVIKEDEWEKRWHVRDDEKLEELCRQLSTETATVRGAFSDGYKRPPRHPNCRCSCSIRRKQGT